MRQFPGDQTGTSSILAAARLFSLTPNAAKASFARETDKISSILMELIATQATPKFRASRWSSVGCWKPWQLLLWAALLIETTISYLLMSPRWPLTGIIYQLYAPDLGIQSWTCINRSGRSWQAFYLSISIINRIHITKPGHK